MGLRRKPSQLTSAHIVLVCPNRNGLIARKRVLEEQGHHVIACRSPKEVLSSVNLAEADILITDYRFDEISGIDLIQQARQQAPEILTILLYAEVEAPLFNEATCGANATVIKGPREVQHLMRAINRLLRKLPKKTSGQCNRQSPHQSKQSRAQGA